MTNTFTYFVAVAALLAASHAGAQSYELTHGRWFDGNTFTARTVYVDRGVFVARRPAHVDSTIDLAGKFIVPPYGEAHNHNIEGSPPATIKKYLDAGIFYVKDPCSFPEASVEAVGKLNIPTSIDGSVLRGVSHEPRWTSLGPVAAQRRPRLDEAGGRRRPILPCAHQLHGRRASVAHHPREQT